MITRPIKSERSLRRYTMEGNPWAVEFKTTGGNWVPVVDKEQAYRCLRGTFGGGEKKELRAVKPGVPEQPMAAASDADVPFADRRYCLKYHDGLWSGAFVNEAEEDIVGWGALTLEQVRALSVHQYATDSDGDYWYRTK